MSNFTHLHVHTQYSILDGAASVESLIAKTKAFGMNSIAITDHGNLYGVLEFCNIAMENDIKPILGCEMYVARGSRFNKDKLQQGGDHLILLAKNKIGYNNLMKLSSLSFQREAYYSKPRIDEELLFQHSEGLICSTACVGGLIPQLILKNDFVEAENAINRYKDVFGDDFYLEVQNHGLNDEDIVRKHLIEFSKKLNIKLIATNDVHFVEKEDFEAHTVLVCLNTGRKISDENKLMYTGEEYMKSEEEMLKLFSDCPEAIFNTQEIVDKIEKYKLTRSPVLPVFDIPSEFGSIDDYYAKYPKEKITEDIYNELLQKGEIAEEERDSKEQNELIERQIEEKGGYNKIVRTKFESAYLRYLTYKGAKKRYGESLPENVEQRISSELATIEWMGFPGYFLIVQDFINYSKDNLDVIVGPGRGSAAGSVVAYCLGITTIEPLRYGLLFERFLNPDRISLPDIDVDFDDKGRERSLNYVREKYGRDHVVQIVNFGTMAARMAIKDVARVLELPLDKSNYLAKLVPEKGTSLEDAYKAEELRYELENGDVLVKKTLKLALKLEGSIRNTGVHPCGVVIGPDEISKYIPVAKPTEKEENAMDNMMVSQFEGVLLESVGMIKMDFLGLKNLSIIKDTCENIKKSHGSKIDIDNISLADKETLELYQQGDTIGTFQFESDGMRTHLQNLKPDCFEDLIAMNALYRPGPMQYIPSFIRRKHGLEKIEYDFDVMEQYLAETYGITIYQEQVMQLSQVLAGFTPGQADKLRKAMGKKQINVMNDLKDKFVKGCIGNGYEEKKVLKIWDDWVEFAKYAFNKSHSTCYSFVAFQTGYLKAHYPGEYMSSVLTHNLKDIKAISFYIDECQRQKINVLGPSVNESDLNFMVNKKGDILFGLAAIKGVGEKAAEEIIKTRTEGGEYQSCYDFIQRIDRQVVNKRCLESLVKSGAFDCFSDIHRAQYLEVMEGKDEQSFLEKLIRYGAKFKEEENSSQASLFGEGEVQILQPPTPPICEPLNDLTKLSYEKEIIGFYVSGHPLDRYRDTIRTFATNKIEDLQNLESLQNKELIIAGVIQSVSERTSKNNIPFGSFRLEDQTGTTDITLFGRDYINFKGFFRNGLSVLIKGRVQPKWSADKLQENVLEFKINKMDILADVLNTYAISLTLFLDIDNMNNQLYDMLIDIAKTSKGNATLNFKIIDRTNEISLTMKGKKHKIDVVAFIEKLKPLIQQRLVMDYVIGKSKF
ncbi:MAG: DNA polymerase III subunit alpha [Bacteroidales bacterium]|jgi:DNA polymerase-3 subunit alpha|nr:DNA polymerase III subunit alpha [Bacteroidales bacterium]